MTTTQIVLITIAVTGSGIVLLVLLWFSLRAAMGDAKSQALLGDSFSRQVILSPIGVRLLKASIVQGHVPAMYYYGYYLQLMTQRQHTALRWLKRAAQRGNGDAAFALAMQAGDKVLDFHGKFSRQQVKKLQQTSADDLVLALSWLLISRDLAHKSAAYKLAQVAELVDKELAQQAQLQAHSWLEHKGINR